MKAHLFIEKLPSRYWLARIATSDTHSSPVASPSRYVTCAKGKPLKFLNIEHIKEYFQGQRIDKVFMLGDGEQPTEIAF
ncbi:hypothetical protein [Marinagarivorans algicola]|uniref:hypothetical protein n=1 Tax=Marinagarivorans algicola TaxID=1513270 RepID=UPI0006B4B6FD|nr:hypothetical protein [Marinagarivorans algicola]